ncbi:MAG: membrane protein insertion efficiency factor YidD [Pseudomonadota bacterium]
MRRILILPIRFYQLCLSPYFPASCRYHPTCSAYAIEAITQHGALRGGYLALHRIVRCNPWSLGGHDPVPPRDDAPENPSQP